MEIALSIPKEREFNCNSRALRLRTLNSDNTNSDVSTVDAS